MIFRPIKVVSLFLLVLAVGGSFGCSPAKAALEDLNVSVVKAQELWEKKEAIIIDVRTEEEYVQGHIPGVALIPLDQLPNRIGEVPKDKKVLIICRSGKRSLEATQLLRSKGYKNVYNITEGMNSWKGPVEKAK
ncbi:MAG: rhodanese-like domain-containing protein [Sporomusaceae bacterium]|nr:rhodanese-like domain-containing protein [Sporomusaceae bacterium]